MWCKYVLCFIQWGERGLEGYNILEISPKERVVQSIPMAHKKSLVDLKPNLYQIMWYLFCHHMWVLACCPLLLIYYYFFKMLLELTYFVLIVFKNGRKKRTKCLLSIVKQMLQLDQNLSNETINGMRVCMFLFIESQ